VFLTAFIFAGGPGVLENGNGSAFVGEMARFGGGNYPFDCGKYCIRVGDIGYSSKKIQGRSVMECCFVP